MKSLQKLKNIMIKHLIKRLKIWKENAQKLWNYKDQKVDYYIHRYQRKKAVMH